MTTLDVYENVLVELNKVEAPSLLLDDFNYFLMKAIHQRVNKDYNYYDMNQQISDSLNSLHRYILLNSIDGIANIPNNYLHTLECSVKVRLYSNKCNEYSSFSRAATRLLSGARGQIESNYYLKPSYKRPYYIIHSSEDEHSQKTIEILYGDKPNVELEAVRFQYLKTPNIIKLTEEQIDGLEKPETMEFSDNICYEIINDVFKLIAQNTSDPRLESHIPINQTINPPIQLGGQK